MTNDVKGIGGWLAVFVVWLGAAALAEILTTAVWLQEKSEKVGRLAYVEWDFWDMVLWGPAVACASLRIFCAVRLCRWRTPSQVLLAKATLWIAGPLVGALQAVIMAIPVGIEGVVDGFELALVVFFAVLVSCIPSLIFAWIWTLYLTKSRRVKNTYGL
ncbi:hypothetical protein PIN31115_04410 [Pandoraea iniqua]|uniref:Transmembrane protein n=1 Tax=Pandoraea iniqua TaxID=2508288 RepID=A0A5E4YDI7_9BURK|nr:DUF2569 family protein [Pandoraea iniqua]VVE46385.1 hypothetical protein PIN31115_04410 [Pandoraea iniqua]